MDILFMDEALFASVILFSLFFFFLIIGIPISVGIAVSSLITILSLLPPPQAAFVAAQKVFAGLDSFPLLAIPFFVLSGNIMNKGGIALRLINLAKLIGGRMPGALAHTNVIANMLFGSISGSSIAAAAAVGGAMAPLQKKEGYDPSFSAAVNIASAPSGILIPPSGPLILFSLVSGGTSVAALFIGGYVPGLLMGLSIILVSYIIAKRRNYPVSGKSSFSEAVRIILDALPSLLLVIIVIGGIVIGAFTPTEGAAVAVLYSFILACCYRTMKFSEFPGVFLNATVMSAIILFLIAASGIMSYAMAFTGIPEAISDLILEIPNEIVVLLLVNIILLVIGTFMDLTPAVLIFTPIFLPIATELGMHPVHFGLMMIFNLGIGNMTPPVGSVLFVGCSVGRVSIEQIVKPLLPFFFILVFDLMLIVYIPSLTLILPRLAGLIY